MTKLQNPNASKTQLDELKFWFIKTYYVLEYRQLNLIQSNKGRAQHKHLRS